VRAGVIRDDTIMRVFRGIGAVRADSVIKVIGVLWVIEVLWVTKWKGSRSMCSEKRSLMRRGIAVRVVRAVSLSH
jgi:hypothetical protein